MKRYLLFITLIILVGCSKEPHCGSYTIGRDQTWFPVQVDLLVPNLNGFTDAFVQEIAQTEKVPMQIINLDWPQLFQALENNEVAGIFTSLSPNVISQEKYSFSNPFLLLGPVLVVPMQSTATSLKDMQGKIVAVNQFDESVLIVQNYPSIVIQLYQQKPQILEILKEGTIDGVLMPILEAHALVSYVYPNQLKIVTAPLNNEALRLIVRKDTNQSLIKHFNSGLNRLYSSGKYDKIQKTFQLF